jgi:outer membrane lipase/esterase
VLHLFLPTLYFATAFSDLYVFGDSLSNSGQFPDIFAGYPHLRATNRTDPSDPYYETAKVWSQYFSEDLSLGQLLPSGLWFGPSGNHYAVVTYTSDKILSTIQGCSVYVDKFFLGGHFILLFGLIGTNPRNP